MGAKPACLSPGWKGWCRFTPTLSMGDPNKNRCLPSSMHMATPDVHPNQVESLGPTHYQSCGFPSPPSHDHGHRHRRFVSSSHPWGVLGAHHSSPRALGSWLTDPWHFDPLQGRSSSCHLLSFSSCAADLHGTQGSFPIRLTLAGRRANLPFWALDLRQSLFHFPW